MANSGLTLHIFVRGEQSTVQRTWRKNISLMLVVVFVATVRWILKNDTRPIFLLVNKSSSCFRKKSFGGVEKKSRFSGAFEEFHLTEVLCFVFDRELNELWTAGSKLHRHDLHAKVE